MRTLRAVALMGVAALALSAPAVQAAPAGPEEDARQLEIQARQLAENHQAYRQAAELYRKAAKLYGPSLEAAAAHAQAGKMAFYDRDNRATDDMKRAGDMAAEFGHVALAAESYLDGAWLAQREGLLQMAVDLATRADRLTESPLLAEAERDALKRRIAERAEDQTGQEAVVRR